MACVELEEDVKIRIHTMMPWSSMLVMAQPSHCPPMAPLHQETLRHFVTGLPSAANHLNLGRRRVYSWSAPVIGAERSGSELPPLILLHSLMVRFGICISLSLSLFLGVPLLICEVNFYVWLFKFYSIYYHFWNRSPCILQLAYTVCFWRSTFLCRF